MTTVAEFAAQMKQGGASDDEIVQTIRSITGKDKPGAQDFIPGTDPGQGGGQPQPLSVEQTLARDKAIMSPDYQNQGLIGNVSAPVEKPQPMSIPPTAQMPTGPAGGHGFPMSREMVQPRQPLEIQQQPQGLMSQLGGGLKSMGQSMARGTKSLFDDPQRMALLQGGLSMMDPNSYYDKQGFGSIFTGLNRGLGAAQEGHKGVMDRRQAAATLTQTGKKGTYQTFDEPSKGGGIKKVTYFVTPLGERTKVQESPVMRMATGVDPRTGKLVGGVANLTDSSYKPMFGKKAGEGNPERAQLLLDEMDKFETLLRQNPVSGSEIPGTAMDAANVVGESFWQRTPFKERAAIVTFINQSTPLLTEEFIDERVSNVEREIVKRALGYSGASTFEDKLRAMPTVRKLLQMQVGGAKFNTKGGQGGYVAGDVKNSPWRKR
jgi:hypothetical protein